MENKTTALSELGEFGFINRLRAELSIEEEGEEA